MITRALGRRLADVARRQTAAAEHLAAQAQVVDAGHAERVAFLMMFPEDLRMAVGIALCDRVKGEYLADWACGPFARWATVPAGFQFPRALVEWLLNPPHPWFLGSNCERCGLGVPLPSNGYLLLEPQPAFPNLADRAESDIARHRRASTSHQLARGCDAPTRKPYLHIREAVAATPEPSMALGTGVAIGQA